MKTKDTNKECGVDQYPNNAGRKHSIAVPSIPQELTTENLLEKIKSEHAELRKIAQNLSGWAQYTLKLAWNLGAMLHVARTRCGHGEWGAWLEKNVPEVSYSTAHRYIKLFSKFSTVEDLPQGISFRDAFRMAGVNLGGEVSEKKVPLLEAGPANEGQIGRSSPIDSIVRRAKTLRSHLAKIRDRRLVLTPEEQMELIRMRDALDALFRDLICLEGDTIDVEDAGS